MFDCSNCGHKIDDSRVPLPPFCPRCGEPTSENSSPFDDDEPSTSPLPPPPPMGAPLPPPPPMGAPLPPPPPMGAPLPPPPRSGRGEPSKTLFGMPGLSFDDVPAPDPGPGPAGGADDELPFPSDDDDDALPFPVDDDEDALPFPVDDDELAAPAAPSPPSPRPPPVRASVKPPPAPGGVKPPPVRAGVKPPPAGGVKPPPARAGAKPPPAPGGLKPPPGRGAKPPAAAAKGVRPPPPPGGAKPPPPPGGAKPPPFRGGGAPPPPRADAFSSGVLPADSGVMAGDSGTFDDDDPFYTGDPDEMPELGSITHGDASTFADENPSGHSGIREFEFQDDGEALELGELGGLDLPTGEAPAPPSRAARPSFDSPEFGGLDLPTPEGDEALGGGELDLPAPAGFAGDLDLPAPSGHDTGGGLDLDLPAPAGPASGGLDLPAPAGEAGYDDGLSLDDLPMPADDLPMPADNLPGPIDDFPAPADGLPDPDGFDALPTSAADLPASADEFPAPVDSLPTPASILPTPADNLPTPVGDLELDLDAGGRPSAAAKAAGESPAAKAGRVGAIAKPKPPGDKPKRDIGRIVIYSVLALVVVGVGGAVVAVQMGLLEPEPAPPPQQGNGQDTPPPSGEPVERPEGVLAKLDQDTPASYVQAYELSEGQPVGRAEAALLIHLRYGPDAKRLAEARQLLAPYRERPEPFVQRVVALDLLAADKPDEALAALGEGGGWRASLYRAWALLAKGEAEKARAAAEAAVEGRPGDQAAKLAVLQIRYAANPVDGLAAMRQAAETSPNHLALQEALMRAARESGRLAEAAEVGQKLQPAAISEAHKAELLRERAGVAMTQGRTGEAMRLLEQALATDESLVSARVDRIDLLLANRDFPATRADIELLLRDQPKNREVLLVAARVELEAGRDDDARAHLAKLGEAAREDPQVHDLLGQAAAMLMKVEEARTSFAEARKLDPFFVEALEHEIDLLVRAEMLDEALALLDEQQTSLGEAAGNDSERGRRARSTVSKIRARLLRDQGELERALTAAEDAASIDPSNNDALLMRAELLGALGQRQAYEEALLELHERTGGYPGLTEPLGGVLLRKGKLDELEQLIGTSLDSPDASREIVLTGAALRLAQDKPEAAQVLAQRILDRDPTDTRAHLLLGRALLALGDYALALDEIESARTREGDPEVELWLGQALEYNGRPGQARVHYQRALELDPNTLEAAALLGRLYAYDGAAAKAIDLLQPVVDATDDYPYAHLALGLARKDMGRRDLAVAEFQKAQELDPTLFEAFYQEGRIHNDQNKHAPAVKALQAGLDKAKDNATERALIDTYRRLGESYKQLGRRAEAKAALEEYMKLAPPNAAGRREVERLLREL
jgi:tetratricopeptide (TPR) repeat protein